MRTWSFTKWHWIGMLWVLWGTPLKSQDMVILKTGDEIEGKVLRVESGKLVVETQIGGGKAASFYPLNNVETVFFGEKFDRNSMPVDPNARLAALKPLWDGHRQYLSIPESSAGEIGLLLAEALIDTKHFQESLVLVTQLSTNDWNIERRLRTAPMKVRVLAGLGRLEEALAEAKALEAQAKDSSTVAFVQLVLGEVEMGRTNYAQALDHFLFNRVFNPKLKEEAAIGLWNAAKIYISQTNWSSVSRTLHDIIRDYPASSVFAQAQTKLKELDPTLKQAEKDKQNESTSIETQ